MGGQLAGPTPSGRLRREACGLVGGHQPAVLIDDRQGGRRRWRGCQRLALGDDIEHVREVELSREDAGRLAVEPQAAVGDQGANPPARDRCKRGQPLIQAMPGQLRVDDVAHDAGFRCDAVRGVHARDLWRAIGPSALGGGGGDGCLPREHDACGSAGGAAGELQSPSVSLDHLAGDGQAKARAARAANGHRRGEPGQHVGWDAGSGIPDLDLSPAVAATHRSRDRWGRRRRCGPRCRGAPAARATAHRPTTRAGVDLPLPP